MNNKDILSVLKSHREIFKVTLGQQVDCVDFFEKFVSTCYNNKTLEKLGVDTLILEALRKFQADGDTLELVNKRGKFLKRFAGYYKKTNGSELTDKVMGIIGDILQTFVNGKESEYFVDFTDVIDWKDGKFGKAGSCWWGMFAGSIPTFQNNGGWCIRFYENETDTQGIGRTWLVPQNDVLLGFNAYGVERTQVSKVLKKIFKDNGFELHFKVVDICNNRHAEIPYINGSTGFVIYENGTYLNDEYDLDMIAENANKCSHCGDVGNEDDYILENDNWYCESCHGELFSFCEKCSDTFSVGDTVEISHKRYSNVCEECAGELGFSQCSSCNDWHDDCIETNEGNLFCEYCNSDNFYCESCEVWLENVKNCQTCTEEEEAEEDENLEIRKETLQPATGDPIGRTKVYSNVNYPGICVYKKGTAFNIYHRNTKMNLMSAIPSLKNSLLALDMFGKVCEWEEYPDEATLMNSIDREKLSSIARFIRGRS